MGKRKIVNIDEEKCNGCGACIPNCPEGALRVIDGKARLVSDLFCDGLGACIGHCPNGAIFTEEREAEPYDESRVMENIVKHGKNTIKAHLEHLKDHGEEGYLKEASAFLQNRGIENPLLTKKDKKKDNLPCGCPGSMVKELKNENIKTKNENEPIVRQASALRQWPVQMQLVPVNAPYLDNSHLLIAADCVPFAYADFHQKLLSGKVLMIGCPKLDDAGTYQEKLTDIFRSNRIKSITVAIMEVPCCSALYSAVRQAIDESKNDIPLIKEIISLKGELK